MPKPQLTTADVDLFLADLYLLSDAELLIEADAVAADYLQFMEDKFDLTTDQSSYISTAPLHVQKFWGYLYATTFISRGPISFPSLPNNPAPRRIKECRENFFGFITYNDDDKELVGSLEVEVEFTLL